jgi:hypothetical protein
LLARNQATALPTAAPPTITTSQVREGSIMAPTVPEADGHSKRGRRSAAITSLQCSADERLLDCCNALD